MEKIKEKICKGLPYFCSAGIQVPKVDIKAEILLPEPNQNNDNQQKPWSVFNDVYWI